MIVAVWMMSFLICFPSLIGWTNWSDWSGLQTLTSKTIALLLTPTPASTGGYTLAADGSPQCSLSSDPGYVLYSAIGSFFAPMVVMLFLNWRVYQTARKSISVRQSF
jgi:octopamine receptor